MDIPIGTDSVPVLTDKPRAIKLKNASRFTDDVCNLNDSGEFSESFYVISPNEVQLKCDDHGLHVTFLDLDITVVDGI